MPGVFSARSQAKWQERKAKLEKKVKKKEEKEEIKEDRIDSQIERRKKALKNQKKSFKKRKYDTLLTMLIEQKEKGRNRYWLRGFRRRILFHYGRSYSSYEDPDAYYKQLLTNEEFEKELTNELKEELENLQEEFIDDFYDEFERTVNRTHFIKDEFMFVLNKINCIRACKTIKEDLMAAAWHPDRVWKWLKAGRYIGMVDGEPQHDFHVLNMMAGYESDSE